MKRTNVRKTTKQEFNRFKKAFLYWQERLNRIDYDARFYHRKLDECYAQIETDHMGRCADVSLCSEFPEDVGAGYKGPEGEAKHEAIHLLLQRLEWLATSRYVMPADIKEEVESLVRILENILVS
jgi:hypothetical protein